jgi:hypothetical protein
MLLIALSGLFAMHGMSDHGVMRHGGLPHGDIMSAGASMAEPHAEPLPTGAAAIVLEAAGQVAPRSGAAKELLDAAAAGSCLAVLAGVALLLLRRVRSWSGEVLRSLLSRAQLVLVLPARDPDPPDLFALSIQRC